MGADIEPDLQYVRNRHTLADDGGAEHRFAEGGNAHEDIWLLFSPLGREPHAFENGSIETLQIEVLWNTVHKAKSQ